jgi:hypothetical protein
MIGFVCIAVVLWFAMFYLGGVVYRMIWLACSTLYYRSLDVALENSIKAMTPDKWKHKVLMEFSECLWSYNFIMITIHIIMWG